MILWVENGEEGFQRLFRDYGKKPKSHQSLESEEMKIKEFKIGRCGVEYYND
jgi:hypothetical protein